MDYETDFLVIGSGIAGLSFALKAATLGNVVIATKKDSIATATNLAQGGIAAVLSREDSFDLHVQDTMNAGAGLCHEDIVRLVVENGPARVRELADLGVHFMKSENDASTFDLTREGGHSARRIAHAYDLTGKEIEAGLLKAAKANPRITILENHMVVDLLMGSKMGIAPRSAQYPDTCLGAYVMDCRGQTIHAFSAGITVLCTGGAGKVYLYTSNPDIATGDGIAIAYRAGAQIANLEFVQFHPTCLYHPKAKNFLISEAVRGEGGILVNGNGQAFMAKYDSRGDLATRDTVARAIDSELKASGADCVYLDITHKPAKSIIKRFPNIYATCLSYGIDMTKEPIPVVPAAHYMCGGILVDRYGHSSIESLYALGETSCTGLHGANRLASNSLLEAVVFAHEAYCRCRTDMASVTARQLPAKVADWAAGTAGRIEECVLITHNWDQIRRLMWDYVGIVRSEKRLLLAQERLAPIQREIRQHFLNYILTADLVELRNIAIVADLIVRSALIRKESRGLHYLIEYPNKDDLSWHQDTIFSKQ